MIHLSEYRVLFFFFFFQNDDTKCFKRESRAGLSTIDSPNKLFHYAGQTSNIFKKAHDKLVTLYIAIPSKFRLLLTTRTEPINHIPKPRRGKDIKPLQRFPRLIPNPMLRIPRDKHDCPLRNHMFSPVDNHHSRPGRDVVDLGLRVSVASEVAGSRCAGCEAGAHVAAWSLWG